MGLLDGAEELGADLATKYIMGIIIARFPFVSFPLLRKPLSWFINWIVSRFLEFGIRGANFLWINFENEGDAGEVEKKFKEMKEAPDKETRKKKEKEYEKAASDLIKIDTDRL